MPKSKPLTIRGVSYSSISEACECLGVNYNAIQIARNRGTLETVGLQKHRVTLQLPRPLYQRILSEVPSDMDISEFIVKAVLEEDFPDLKE